MRTPLLTSADRTSVILSVDHAVNLCPDDWRPDMTEEEEEILAAKMRGVYSDYLRTDDESLLNLDGEPVRYEYRGLTATERMWAKGEAVKMSDDLGGNMMLRALVYARASLDSVRLPGEDEPRKVKRTYVAGMQIATAESVMDLCGDDPDTVFHVGLIAQRLSEVSRDLGKSSSSPQGDPTEKAKSDN